MKSLAQISKACDYCNSSDLSRLARLLGISSKSSYLRASQYSDEDAERIIQTYWNRRNISVAERVGYSNDN